jgi:SAM-dependent methyltransferase
MSSKSFENYRRVAAQEGIDDTEVAGRFRFQGDAERLIVGDLLGKLRPGPEHTLLEIGCGPGNLLVPLSAHVRACVGIDNDAALARLARRVPPGRQVEGIAGDFMSIALAARRFDRVLIYSVMQYLDDAETAWKFIARALSLVAPGGRLLVGDLPNQSKKRRYAESASGRAGVQSWRAQVDSAGPHPLDTQPRDDALLDIDDDLVLSWMAAGRKLGFETYLLEQPPELPFGNSREDLLFVARD